MKVYRLDPSTPRLAFSLTRIPQDDFPRMYISGEHFYYSFANASGDNILRLLKVENGREYLIHSNDTQNETLGIGLYYIAGYAFDLAGGIYFYGNTLPDSGSMGIVGKLINGQPKIIAGNISVDGPGSATVIESNVGTNAVFGSIYDVWIDKDGDIFALDNDNAAIIQIKPSGRTRIFGRLETSPSVFRFTSRHGITGDNAGNIYVAVNSALVKFNANGDPSVVAGVLGTAGSANGMGADARFSWDNSATPYMAMNSLDKCIYLMDDNGIRKITENGLVTTIAPPSSHPTTAGSYAGNIIVDAKGAVYVMYPDSGP